MRGVAGDPPHRPGMDRLFVRALGSYSAEATQCGGGSVGIEEDYLPFSPTIGAESLVHPS
jgi:hypothetical protein